MVLFIYKLISFIGPALDSVEYEMVTFRGAQDDDNPYKGHPSPELDAAWGQLTEGKTHPLLSACEERKSSHNKQFVMSQFPRR